VLPHVLRLAIDTLEVTYRGELISEMHGRLAIAKQEAQSGNAPVPIVLGGVEFFVQPTGLKGYDYRVENDYFQLRIGVSKYRPLVWAKFLAYGLATIGPEPMLKRLPVMLADLGAIEQPRLSRVDVACDVQGFEVTEAEMRNVVWKGRYRNYHEEGDGITYQFGKRDCVVRIYNKTVQAKKKRLSYVQELWEACLGYDHTKDVQRIEVQLRGGILTELRLLWPATALGRIAAILAFGMEWAELKVPTKDATRARWPVDPRWSHIRETCRPSAPLKRILRTPRLEARDRSVKRLLGALATIAAYDGLDDLGRVSTSVVSGLLDQVDKGELDFGLLVEAKRRRLGVSDVPEGAF